MDYLVFKELYHSELQHHGIKGQKWGIRRTPEQLGHHKIFKPSTGGNYSPNDKVFVSGKIKFDEPLSGKLASEIKNIMKAKSEILIGDAPGADTRIQHFLNQNKYRNVTVYTTDKNVRNNIGNWAVKHVESNGEIEERAIRRQKDILMTNLSTKAIVVSSDDDRKDSAVGLNIERLINQNKSIQFYDYKSKQLRSNR